jgi:hypothetical protein
MRTTRLRWTPGRWPSPVRPCSTSSRAATSRAVTGSQGAAESQRSRAARSRTRRPASVRVALGTELTDARRVDAALSSSPQKLLPPTSPSADQITIVPTVSSNVERIGETRGHESSGQLLGMSQDGGYPRRRRQQCRAAERVQRALAVAVVFFTASRPCTLCWPRPRNEMVGVGRDRRSAHLAPSSHRGILLILGGRH